MTKFSLLAVAAALGFAASAHAESATYAIDPNHTFATFEIGHFGTSTNRGRFNKTAGTVTLDKAAKTGALDVTVDTTSLDTGSAAFTKHVSSEEMLNVAKFPNATFASTSIKASGGGKFDVAGKLTVKGITKDVVVPIALTQAGPTTTATGAFTIKRNDFHVGEGEWSDTSQLANEVAVKFKIALTGVAPL